VRLGGAEGRHAVSVRRLGPGEPLDLVDGLGRRVTGTVASIVEGEARADVDLGKVAQVVENRLADPAGPTVGCDCVSAECISTSTG